MRGLCGLIASLALLLWCAPLQAQWSGYADLSAGIGVMKDIHITEDQPLIHGLAQGNFQLNYNKNKFSWTTTVEGKWEPKTTDNSRLAYKDGKLNITYKSAQTRPFSTGLKSDFRWTPSAVSRYSTWIQYKFKNDNAYNHSLSFNGTESEMENASYYFEVPTLSEHRLETGFKSFNSFQDGRSILESSLTLQAIRGNRVNTWTVLKTEDDGGQGTAVDLEDLTGYAWKYRLTPYSFDFNMDGDIHVQRTLLDEEVKLKLTPGARMAIMHAMDENSGATRINISLDDNIQEEWRDSTRLRESFDYLSLQAEPYLKADFLWKSLEAHADYTPQVYGRRLNDDTHQQPLQIKGVYPVGKANVKWTISPRHSLNLSNKMSVSHPDYLKICWYDRSAGYLDQLYRGNEQLKSPQTRTYSLDYIFKYKRFSSQTGVSFKRVEDEIDQTWSNEEIDGRLYKVFRWLNSADSYSAGLSQKLSWQGKIITANVAVNYNQSRRVAKSNAAVKNSFDWKLTGDIAARLGKGWSIGAEAKYQSKVATFFTLFNEYCEVNAFVQKEFKHVTLYLRGKDLMDKPVTTEFLSEEQQEAWVEEVRSNRRIVILGAKWKF